MLCSKYYLQLYVLVVVMTENKGDCIEKYEYVVCFYD